MDTVRAKQLASGLKNREVGGWTVGEYLGNGNSAVVLSAKKEGQEAALKLIDPEMVERMGLESQIRRITLERRLIGHQYPYLVKIMDAGQCSATALLFVAMELLEPHTLDQVLSVIPSHNVGTLIFQLAEAARYLESIGIVHRDIKPSNVYVSSDYSSLILLDLGVIRVSSDPYHDGAGTENHFLGTARYSPPEFLYRREEDTVEAWRAITFYQLGATLYDLIVQRPLFGDFSEPPAVLYEAVSSHSPVIESDDHEPWLINLARRCLIKDWRNRLASVRWEDFEGPQPVGSASQIRERISRRVVRVFSPTSNGPNKPLGPSRRVLESLSRTIATVLRDLCRGGNVFPPVYVDGSVSDSDCIIMLVCGPSETHSLLGILQVRIVVTYVDEVTSIVRVLASSRLCANGRDRYAPWRGGDVRVAVGAADGADTREALDRYIHAALECALATTAECGSPIPLPVD